MVEPGDTLIYDGDEEEVEMVVSQIDRYSQRIHFEGDHPSIHAASLLSGNFVVVNA